MNEAPARRDALPNFNGTIPKNVLIQWVAPVLPGVSNTLQGDKGPAR